MWASKWMCSLTRPSNRWRLQAKEEGYEKHQIPNSKSQKNPKSQARKRIFVVPLRVPLTAIEAWNLGASWDLDFGVWDFLVGLFRRSELPRAQGRPFG